MNKRDDLKYDPVPFDREAFFERAKKHKGFIEAYEKLEEEYAAIRAQIEARINKKKKRVGDLPGRPN